jgi:hypothetical protein
LPAARRLAIDSPALDAIDLNSACFYDVLTFS